VKRCVVYLCELRFTLDFWIARNTTEGIEGELEPREQRNHSIMVFCGALRMLGVLLSFDVVGSTMTLADKKPLRTEKCPSRLRKPTNHCDSS
jgi:hypothetical protein